MPIHTRVPTQKSWARTAILSTLFFCLPLTSLSMAPKSSTPAAPPKQTYKQARHTPKTAESDTLFLLALACESSQSIPGTLATLAAPTDVQVHKQNTHTSHKRKTLNENPECTPTPIKSQRQRQAHVHFAVDTKKSRHKKK